MNQELIDYIKSIISVLVEKKIEKKDFVKLQNISFCINNMNIHELHK